MGEDKEGPLSTPGEYATAWHLTVTAEGVQRIAQSWNMKSVANEDDFAVETNNSSADTQNGDGLISGEIAVTARRTRMIRQERFFVGEHVVCCSRVGTSHGTRLLERLELIGTLLDEGGEGRHDC